MPSAGLRVTLNTLGALGKPSNELLNLIRFHNMAHIGTTLQGWTQKLDCQPGNLYHPDCYIV